MYIIILPWHSNKSSCGGSGEKFNYLKVGRNIPLQGVVETIGLLFSWMHLCHKNDYVPLDCSVLTVHLLLKALHITQLCVAHHPVVSWFYWLSGQNERKGEEVWMCSI